MNTVCVPVDSDEGWDAPLAAHFSAAPWFALVRGTQVEWVDASGAQECGERVSLLSGHGATIVLARGVSLSNLKNLQARGILALESGAPDLRQAVLSLMMGAVKPFESGSCCGRHDHEDGGCAHNA